MSCRSIVIPSHDPSQTAGENAPFELSLEDLVPEREGFDRYLEDTSVVDWQSPAVAEKARELCDGRASDEARVRGIFEFVRDEIRHSDDIDTDVLPCSASQVLREATGLCYAKCHLMVALLRARGIPAGFCYQRLRRSEGSDGFVLHGLVAVHLESKGRWILLDPRGGNGRVEFQSDAPCLAFPIDPEAGEGIYATIMARPSKRVVDLLEYAGSLAQARKSLPDAP